MRPPANSIVSRNASRCVPPRPSTQVPMKGRQVAVQAVSPSDTPSSQTANSMVCCGSSDGSRKPPMLFPLCQPDHLVLRHAFRSLMLHALLVVLARRAEQLDAEETDLDHIVVGTVFGATPAQGAVLVK